MLSLKFTPRGQVNLYVAPLIQDLKKPFRDTSALVHTNRPWLGSVQKTEKIVDWITGSQLQFRHGGAGGDPGDISGETVHTVAGIDEAGKMPADTWGYMLPMFRRFNAYQFRYGTPRGRNEFYAGYIKGLDRNGNSPMVMDTEPVDPRYLSIRAPSTVAPWFTPEELEAARADIPSEQLFRQEYLADFIDDAGEVFGPSLAKCSTGQLEEPIATAQYIIAVDLGRKYDFTSIRVARVDEPRILFREVASTRLGAMAWPDQYRLIRDWAHRWNHARVVVDATGVGDPAAQTLVELGLKVDPVVISPKMRNDLIENLVAKMQGGQCVLLGRAVDPVAWEEGKDFRAELEYTDRGNLIDRRSIRYGPPRGRHDDTVIARALLAWSLHTAVHYVPIA